MDVYMVEIKEEHKENASEFIEYLRLSNEERWGESPSSPTFHRNWYFRGQADANWSLKPRILRDKTDDNIANMIQKNYFDEKLLIRMREILETYCNKESRNPNFSEINRQNAANLLQITMAEILIVDEFVRLAQRALGFAIPEITKWNYWINKFRNNPMGLISEYEEKYEENGLWRNPAVVIAQHHSIPTRLLDWTMNPMKAALFASSDKPDSKTTKLGVYAFHQSHFEDSDVILYHPPLSVTSFLHAQEGLFTLDRNSNKFFIENGRFPSINETIESGNTSTQIPPPRLITLPITERFELFRQLWIENYTNAHLMPTLDNVAKAVKLKIEAMPIRN
jgi:hypothetical protein